MNDEARMSNGETDLTLQRFNEFNAAKPFVIP